MLFKLFIHFPSGAVFQIGPTLAFLDNAKKEADNIAKNAPQGCFVEVIDCSHTKRATVHTAHSN